MKKTTDYLDLATDSTDFLNIVNERSGQTIQRCYFCKKCASGCPVASFYDYLPYQIIRMAQFGMKNAILRSRTVWLCSTCGTCATRCPNDVDLVKVMDTLKEISIEEGAKAGQREIKLFHNLFLSSIRQFGRLHEASLLGFLKFKTGDLFKDLLLGMKLIKKGKIPLFPTKIEGISEIRELFKKSREASP